MDLLDRIRPCRSAFFVCRLCPEDILKRREQVYYSTIRSSWDHKLNFAEFLNFVSFKPDLNVEPVWTTVRSGGGETDKGRVLTVVWGLDRTRVVCKNAFKTGAHQSRATWEEEADLQLPEGLTLCWGVVPRHKCLQGQCVLLAWAGGLSAEEEERWKKAGSSTIGWDCY
jgi:hypothetical protein